ncbi:MAG: hypothetical protein IKZ86_05915 [Spirochaetaceae bacterium]|nr:hypothetical protein [Spirochaetaceae bacterium]
MATSSLKKSFVISSKKEADAFAKMLADSLKNPPPPIKEVNVKTLSKDEVRKFIDAHKN